MVAKLTDKDKAEIEKLVEAYEEGYNRGFLDGVARESVNYSEKSKSQFRKSLKRNNY